MKSFFRQCWITSSILSSFFKSLRWEFNESLNNSYFQIYSIFHFHLSIKNSEHSTSDKWHLQRSDENRARFDRISRYDDAWRVSNRRWIIQQFLFSSIQSWDKCQVRWLNLALNVLSVIERFAVVETFHFIIFSSFNFDWVNDCCICLWS